MTGKNYLWFVKHPAHCQAPVVAADREQATVAAARLWGVPWRTVAADCDTERRGEARKHLCARCGQYNYGDGELCEPCRSALKAEEQSIRVAKRAYYRRNAGEIRRILQGGKTDGAME